MGVDEFNRISRMIHLNNVEAEIPRGREGHDPWSKVRPILDKINQKSKHHYTPSQNVSIDESMIGMKNRCVFLQYMPNKRHARFGVKKFQLCDTDSNGYLSHVHLYAGKDLDVLREEVQAHAVVRTLMQESQFLNKGYRLFTDNFYTKPKTAEFLFANKTALVGTVRVNSVGMLKNVAKQKLQVGEAKFWRKYPSDMLAVTFREKKSQTKPVLAHSTCHDAGMETKTIKGKQKTKPVLIFYYNKYMGGVDLSDKKIYHYAAERSTRRYWKKIFHNLIDIAILNSWILFSLSTGKKLDRERFIIEVVENLCEGDDIANALPPAPQPVLWNFIQ
ncbi:PiggyBac transposase uribo2 [Plakobranchus ocellatus]|uniref:PiggyBac transposase uribo2 n=1 Tax=Plakobranchus ocellatus TaxID=259542 RepID=A0AAV4CXE3_9GAST|nr:PiggyBac transposase uribo2 [Plakobranchus ocellatus]